MSNQHADVTTAQEFALERMKKRNPDWVMNMMGREFVKYEGLLDTAHQEGLCRISTTLIQVPHQDNGNVAIVHAEVETKKGTFSGIGDASPANVGRMIVPHIIRMAECVPLRAEILTPDGWQRYDRLRPGDTVLSYDVAANVCEWTDLEAITVYEEPHEVVRLSSRSFSAVCTPEHTWAVTRQKCRPALVQTKALKAGHRITVAAPCIDCGANLDIEPRDAAILGWLATDGSIYEQMVENRYGPYKRAVISQSKPHYVEELRRLTAGVATESVGAAYRRDFGTYVSDCLPGHKFQLRSAYAESLLDRAGIEDGWITLPHVVTRLSAESRAAMLDAMLKGDGTRKGEDRWVFGKKSKPGVMEAFEILATLEGRALGIETTASVGDVPLRTVRANCGVTTQYLTVEPAEPQPVWCPTTKHATWVMRLDGTITITGNTRAKARALRDAVNIGVTAVEEMSESDRDESKTDTSKPEQRNTQHGGMVVQDGDFGSPPPNTHTGGDWKAATEQQAKMIYAISMDLKMDRSKIPSKGVVEKEWSFEKASKWIDSLKAEQERRKADSGVTV